MPPPSGLAASVASAILFLALWPSWTGVWSRWMDYAPHGLAVTVLVLWLLWRDRVVLLRFGGRTDPRLLAVVVLASVTWFLAAALSVQVAQQVVALAILVLWSGLLGGAKVMRTTGPLAATFLLALPLWSVLTRPLQLITIAANSTLLRVAGPEAVIRGQSITIPSGTFLVEGSCSGLNYLMVALVLGVTYGHLFLQRWRSRLLVIAAAAVLAMAGNWLRVYGLVLVGHWTEMQSSLMADHVTYGWVIFVVTLGPFFLIARRIEDTDRSQREDAEQFTPIRVDPKAEASVPHGGAAPQGPGRWALLMPLLATSLGPALYLLFVVLPGPLPVRDSFSGIQGSEQAWPETSVMDDAADLPEGLDWKPLYRGYDSVAVTLRRDAVNPDRVVLARRFIYRSQGQGRELVNDLNRMAAPDEVVATRVRGPLPPNGRSVNEVVIRRGEEWILAWYWFHVAGFDVRSPTVAKLLELLSIVHREVASELVVVSTRCEPADCSEAAQALGGLVLGVQIEARGAR